MERLLWRTSTQLPRLLRVKNVTARFYIRAFSSFPTRPQSIVSDNTLLSKIPESSRTPANSAVANLFSLQDRTVIVTGAGQGLGSTLALAVLEAGGNVACLDVRPQPDEVGWRRIDDAREKSGLDATYYQCDATDEEQVQRVLAEVAVGAKEKRRPIRGLIHCAGIQQMVDAIDYPTDGFRRILDVNVTGSFIMAKHTALLMKEAGVAGSIVFIASMSGHIANRVCLPSFLVTAMLTVVQGIHCSAYNTSKSAVHQLCRSLATEWGRFNIRVNTLSPGYIRTAMTDQLLVEKPEMKNLWMAGALLGRLGAPEDFKAPAIYMLGDGAAFMTGADLLVDGGHCASA